MHGCLGKLFIFAKALDNLPGVPYCPSIEESMLNLKELPKAAELMPLVLEYAEITHTPLDECLAEALAEWLLGTASTRMRTELVRQQVREYMMN